MQIFFLLDSEASMWEAEAVAISSSKFWESRTIEQASLKQRGKNVKRCLLDNTYFESEIKK